MFFSDCLWKYYLKNTFIARVIRGNITEKAYNFLQCYLMNFILKLDTQVTTIYSLVPCWGLLLSHSDLRPVGQDDALSHLWSTWASFSPFQNGSDPLYLPQRVFMLRGSKQKMAASDECPLSYSLRNPKFTENSGSPGGERERDSGIEGKKVERIKMVDSSKMRKAQGFHILGSASWEESEGAFRWSCKGNSTQHGGRRTDHPGTCGLRLRQPREILQIPERPSRLLVMQGRKREPW